MADISQEGFLDFPEEPPYGFCACGCGNKTTVSPKSHARNGWVRGEPRRFYRGHSHRKALSERYEVDEGTGCWNWTGGKDKFGYGKMKERRPGRVGRQTKTGSAYRFFYIRYVGPIPEGLHIDHLCRNPSCVNPAHLEPVTLAENSRRGANAKLSKEDVHEIRGLLSVGWAQAAIAPAYGVSQPTIGDINTGRKWAGV